MFRWFKRCRDDRYIARHPLSGVHWARALALPALRHLNAADQMRLQRKVQLLLRDKSFYGAHGFAVTDWMRLRIAAEACLPTLYLDADCYAEFVSIVVYETAFVARHEHEDDIGVVHATNASLSGEAWERGPVILSWQDIELSVEDGNNLVLHEFAHKLDLGTGATNGFPPLRAGMTSSAWSGAFSAAHARACTDVDAGRDPGLDPYATTDPGEFFAVVMEAFFMTPSALMADYPDVYAQMRLWLGQDPAAKIAEPRAIYNPALPAATAPPTPDARPGASLVSPHPKPRRTPGTRSRDRADHRGR